ncbi:Cytochrome P450 98A2 [Bienertia sinuspersici]
MEYLNYISIVILFSFTLFCYLFWAKDGVPINWPFIGMHLAILKNVHRFHDFVIELMEKSPKMTCCFRGPWFTNMSFIITVNPTNIHHVFSKSFANYNKGPKFHEIFENLGDGIFNAESNVWEYHRKMAHSFLNHPNFQTTLINTIRDEMENWLIPLFDHVSKNNIEIDLLDVFKRFTYDNSCTILMNHNPNYLSIDFPPTPFSKAIGDLEALMFKRHVTPSFIWKSLNWLGVGDERKYKQDCKAQDDFLYKSIAMKREERSSSIPNEPKKDVDEVTYNDLLALYMIEQENGKTPINTNGDKFLRDSMLSFVSAGGQTTSVAFSWFFYLLSKNPQVTTKIREELKDIMAQNQEKIDGFLKNFNEYNNKLVYLHAAICESLRLYPPVAFNHKASISSDILPSGHQLKKDMHILFDTYAVGRMKLIWGDDCNEFKPERWISERGKVKLEPSYKFIAFGAGPRICQGKDMAFTQLKFVIATILQKYDIEAVQGQQVIPELSVTLNMKHGFKFNLPPGPKPWPIVGNLYRIKPVHFRCFNEWAQIYGPIISVWFGSKLFIVVSNSDLAKEVLKEHDQELANRIRIKSQMNFNRNGMDLTWADYGPHYVKVRKLCTLELFTSKKIEAFKPIREDEVSNMIEKYLGEAALNHITRLIFGKRIINSKGDLNGQFGKEFMSILLELSNIEGPNLLRVCTQWLIQRIFDDQAMDKHEDQLGNFAKKIMKDDDRCHFVEALLSCKEECDLDEDTMIGLLWDMVIAGKDTIAIVVEWAMAELVRNPRILQKAQYELDNMIGHGRTILEEDFPNLLYLQAIVKEALRLHPPTPLLLPHRAQAHVKIEGYDVPKETIVLVNVWAMGRDPDVWPNPLEFCPERFLKNDVNVKGHNFRMLPFGAGRRICPGTQLGLNLVTLMLGRLLHQFDWIPPNGVKFETTNMSEAPGVVTYMATPLQLVPVSRLRRHLYKRT